MLKITHLWVEIAVRLPFPYSSVRYISNPSSFIFYLGLIIYLFHLKTEIKTTLLLTSLNYSVSEKTTKNKQKKPKPTHFAFLWFLYLPQFVVNTVVSQLRSLNYFHSTAYMSSLFKGELRCCY